MNTDLESLIGRLRKSADDPMITRHMERDDLMLAAFALERMRLALNSLDGDQQQQIDEALGLAGKEAT